MPALLSCFSDGHKYFILKLHPENIRQTTNKFLLQMKDFMKTKILYLITLLITFIVGCNTINITSYWHDNEVTIDGNGTDWQGKTWIIKDFQNISFGFMNDEDYLYLSITTSDRWLQRQIAMDGLTVWFDREGGTDKKFGIHYPLPTMRDMSMERRTRQDMENGLDIPINFHEQFSDELEIYGPGKDEHHRSNLLEMDGIDVAIKYFQGLLVYEMKVPITDKGSQPYVIGAKAGSVIGVGVETTRKSMQDGRGEKRMSNGKPGGGMGSGMGGGAGKRGGRMQSNNSEMKEPLKLWSEVALATRNSIK